MRLFFTTILILFAFNSLAQLDIRPGIARNFYNINFGKESDYFYGGTGNGSIGPVLDLEWRFDRRYWRKKDTVMTLTKMALTLHRSLLLGIHYTSHQHTVIGLNQTDDEIFSDWKNKYLHLPLFYKFNFQPFVLDENFNISLGLGVVNSFLLSSFLEENATIFMRDQNGQVINEEFISDRASVKPYANQHLMMFGIEMAGSFKRLYIAIRAWFTLSDQYMPNLKDNWSIPNQYSVYLGSYDTWDKITYSGGGFVLGWKVN